MNSLLFSFKLILFLNSLSFSSKVYSLKKLYSGNPYFYLNDDVCLQGGESSVEGSSGFQFSGSKSFGVSGGFVKGAEVVPVAPVVVETVKPVHKEVTFEAVNEVNPLPLTPAKAHFAADVNVRAEAPATVIVKEVSKLRAAIRNYHQRRNMNKFESVISTLLRPFSLPGHERRLRVKPRHIYEYRQVCVCKYF